MAPQFGNNGQLSRDERVQLYGIDCEDQVMWHEWTPGVESVQDLVLQNVALVTQKVKFKLPPTKEFDMPYPEPFKLAPGMKKVIPISFRPSKYVPHVDRVQIVTKGGSFFVTVKAVVKDVALSVPHFLDFGLCPTMERSQQQIEVYNTGTLKASMKWHARPPFTVRCPAAAVDVGQSVRCTIEFEPKTASVFDGLIACEVASGASIAVEEDDESSARSPEVKQYALQCTGVGKMPHLCLETVMSGFIRNVLCFALLTSLSVARRIRANSAGRSLLLEVEEQLGSELRQALSQRAPDREEHLRHTFLSLPQNSRGAVGPGGARYALHRLFVQLHGWQMKGLRMEDGDWYRSSPLPAFGNHLPQHLHTFLETRVSHGLDLHELAIAAGLLEHKVHDQAEKRLSLAYKALKQELGQGENGRAGSE
eukprot:s867_g6.t1